MSVMEASATKTCLRSYTPVICVLMQACGSCKVYLLLSPPSFVLQSSLPPAIQKLALLSELNISGL